MSTEDQRENTGRGRENLVPWKPGQSGNPGGRPKGQSITSVLRTILDEEAKFKGNTNGKLLKEIVADVLVKHALKGNMKAMSILLDRHDGKVPLPVTTGPNGSAYRIKVEYADVDVDPTETARLAETDPE